MAVLTPLATVRDYARRYRLDESEVIELWNERAAIRQFDGGMSREDAEQAAVIDVAERWKR